MSDNINAHMDDLERAYDIIEQFEAIVRTEIIDKGMLPLSRTYESLNAALGYISNAMDEETAAGKKKLALNVPETRDKIIAAAQACDLTKKNLKYPDGDLAHAVAFLESCFYALLDKTYVDSSKDAIDNILEICDCGDETLDTIATVDDTNCDDEYLNPSGQRVHPRIEQFREVFSMLRPRYDPDKANNPDEKGTEP